MIRLTLVFLMAFFMSSAFADELEKESTAIPQAGANVDTDEAIVHQHDLSTHMGWSEQQAVFKSPRSFRTKELNEISPESLDDLQADSNN
ncbi:MAG: hypothetical protein ACXVA9_00310 [Bdellovibrionales bacterium]